MLIKSSPDLKRDILMGFGWVVLASLLFHLSYAGKCFSNNKVARFPENVGFCMLLWVLFLLRYFSPLLASLGGGGFCDLYRIFRIVNSITAHLARLAVHGVSCRRFGSRASGWHGGGGLCTLSLIMH